MYHNFLKDFSIFYKFILIIILFPLMIIISILIWYKIGFPIFIQKRPGLIIKSLNVYKFKTLLIILNLNMTVKEKSFR